MKWLGSRVFKLTLVDGAPSRDVPDLAVEVLLGLGQTHGPDLVVELDGGAQVEQGDVVVVSEAVVLWMDRDLGDPPRLVDGIVLLLVRVLPRRLVQAALVVPESELDLLRLFPGKTNKFFNSLFRLLFLWRLLKFLMMICPFYDPTVKEGVVARADHKNLISLNDADP